MQLNLNTVGPQAQPQPREWDALAEAALARAGLDAAPAAAQPVSATHIDAGTVKVPCEVWSRIVGYMTPVGLWNTGKQQEFAERKTFVMPE